MALSVKSILGIVIVINILTMGCLFWLSNDTDTLSLTLKGGPNRREYMKIGKPFYQSVSQNKSILSNTENTKANGLDDKDDQDTTSDALDDHQDASTDDIVAPNDTFNDQDLIFDNDDDNKTNDNLNNHDNLDKNGNTQIFNNHASDFIAEPHKDDKPSKNESLTNDDKSFGLDGKVVINDDDDRNSKDTNNYQEHQGEPIDKIDIVEFKKMFLQLNNQTKQASEIFNPFRELGFYKEVGLEHFNQDPGSKPMYNSPHTGLKINSSFCDYNDLFNLLNPSNLFDQMHFISDYDKTLVRTLVIPIIGIDVMPQVSTGMVGFREAIYDLDIRSTMFFTKKVDFHFFHEVGRQFLCVSQMYNHIPGHGIITRKDFLVGSVNAYSDSYSHKSHCFNKNTFFPYAYRFDNATECIKFFDEINDESYFLLKKKISFNYLIKVGYNAHRASGVFLFDQVEEDYIRTEYKNGSLCGKKNDPLLAQKYIGNPLLLDRHNKFDFRMYMLIASVDPLILYYHDGFLRVSLETYDSNSTDKNVHLTNTHLSKEKFKNTKNQTLEAELRDYQMWSLSRLQEHLLKIGKITDPNWLDNYLRPLFKKAYIHLVKMSHSSFFKHSSVYEMFGIDFMLDDDLQLWLIEVNGSPQLIGTNSAKEKLMVELVSDLFEIEYSYLRSKIKRLLAIVHRVYDQLKTSQAMDLNAVKEEFAKANKNFLEPEWQIRSNISWQKVLDENIPGKGAYMGLLEDDCILDR